MQLINQVQNILCSAAVQRNNVCSAVAKSLRRCISAASHLLSKAVSKGLSACFDVAFRSRYAFVMVFAGVRAIIVPFAKISCQKLRSHYKQQQSSNNV